jgi:hypothetical protein
MVILNHHFCDQSGYDRRFGIRAGKASDRIQRVPPGHYQEFNSSAQGSRMDRGVNEAREFPKSWEGFSAEVVNVVLRPILKSYAAPVSRNHAALLWYRAHGNDCEA